MLDHDKKSYNLVSHIPKGKAGHLRVNTLKVKLILTFFNLIFINLIFNSIDFY